MSTLHPSRVVIISSFLLLSFRMNSVVQAELPRYLFGTPHLVEGISTPDTIDWTPALATDELEMFFSRRGLGEDGIENDIHVSRRPSKDEPWGIPELAEELNTDFSDGAGGISLSSNGLTIYYTFVSENDSIYEVRTATRASRTGPFGQIKTLFGGPPPEPPTVAPSVNNDDRTLYVQRHEAENDLADIYVSHRTGVNQPWGDLIPVPELSDPNKWQSRPHISSDSRTLFFYEDETNLAARGNGDLLMLVRESNNASWSEPINLGSAINTGNFEDFAHLSFDGATFYFGRQLGAPGSNENGKDIWEAPVLPFQATSMSGKGGAYSQKFDDMGTVSTAAGTSLPTGWTFTANDVVFNNMTTARFPATRRNYAGVYNAGLDSDADRALVTDNSVEEGGELDLRALVQDAPLQALRLGFDLEAWQVHSSLGDNKGEAAFNVVLEADAGTGFAQVADLGTVTTGATLSRPAAGNLVNGNDAAYRVSYDSGPLDVNVPQGATLRVRWMSTAVSQQTVVFGLDNVSLRFAAPGDANIDGVFNSGDLVHVFQIGEYENAIGGDSTWSDGDWNNDNEFDSRDLVVAFQAGGYVAASSPTTAVPEPTSSVLLVLGLLSLVRCRGGNK